MYHNQQTNDYAPLRKIVPNQVNENRSLQSDAPSKPEFLENLDLLASQTPHSDYTGKNMHNNQLGMDLPLFDDVNQIPPTTEGGANQENQSTQTQTNEILCKANNDCISTTFCCSGYSCVNPRTCLHGNKTENDFCDYNFECLSRCCVNGRCNHILECYSQCQTNADCQGKTIEGKRVDNQRG